MTRLVSIPDFLNSDLASVAGKYPLHVARYGDSYSPDQKANINTILDTLAGLNPDAVLVAGDLVEGHWGRDVLNTGIFGPVGTWPERTAQMQRASDHYYNSWLSRFRKRDHLPVHAAVGDHEMGDNEGAIGWTGWKLANQVAHKEAFGKWFCKDDAQVGWRYANRPLDTIFENTCYGTKIGNVYLCTVDVFVPRDGTVHYEIAPEVAAWLDDSLAAARADDDITTLIVQGHCPVIGPVRRRKSSGLMVEGSTASALWTIMRDHEVELYLCGEVHDTTCYAETGTVQVSHGSLAYNAQNVNFLIVDTLAGGGLDLTYQQWDPAGVQEMPRVWGLDPIKAAPVEVGRLADVPLRIRGTLHLGPGNVATGRRGYLTEGI